MLKKSFVVTLIFVISLFIQLVSQIVITRIFGASQEVDIFLAAVAIPSIIVTVIYGSLNNVLLPLLGEKKNQKSYERYVSSLVLSLGIFAVITAGVITLFSGPLSKLLYPGSTEEFTSNVAGQMRVLFWSIPFAFIATTFGAYYYVQKHFFRFPLAQLVGSITNLLLIVTLFNVAGIWALVMGFVLNIVFQILFVVPKFKTFPKLEFHNITPILISLAPLIVGQFMIRSDTIIIRSYASYLPEGYMVYLNLVSKIFSLATSVMTIGIQVLLLPHLVEYLNEKKYEKAIQSVNRAKLLSIGLSVLVVASLIILGPLAVKILFEGGKFTEEDVKITSSLLPLFIIPGIGWGLSGVFFQPLFALKKYMEVGIISTLAFIAAITTSQLLFKTSGPEFAIISGLIVLLFIGIIGSELIWQMQKQLLTSKKK
ncbi:hypothetical protein IPM65_04910 [Candidatus Roizmanbacteria bacterium]|nr:MAG: hypothetical protein IPM65_04910 [Candidatus Roizmanbacteria bacterium]